MTEKKYKNNFQVTKMFYILKSVGYTGVCIFKIRQIVHLRLCILLYVSQGNGKQILNSSG